MTDLSDNVPEYSVSELSSSVKRSIETHFGHVRVRAELSGVKRAASGHLYFALKDENALLDGVMWRGQAGRLGFEPEDGLEVVCTGQVTTYPARSKYQMKVDRMEPAGAGALMALLEERKKNLAAEGLFEAGRKQPIPFLPRHIGVVTSPTGAVIRDILHRLRDRFPVHVTLWPVKVQGEGAADEIAAAVRGFNALPDSLAKPDMVIVARGGGSIEDLWSFNEEQVVRAVAESRLPIISAVGHETDTTLIDYASDRRAPTPTGAAEMAVPVRDELMAQVKDLERRLDLRRHHMIEEARGRVAALARALPKPRDLLALATQRFDDVSDRLPRALMGMETRRRAQLAELTAVLSTGRLMDRLSFARRDLTAQKMRLSSALGRPLERAGDRLKGAGRLLETLGYEATLKRGYAVVLDEGGQAVTTSKDMKTGDGLTLRLQDGDTDIVVGKGAVSNMSAAPKAAKRKQAAKPASDSQGSLF